MSLEAAVGASKGVGAMARSLKAVRSLEVVADEGRPVLGRQGSLTPRGCSPKVDWRATSPRMGGGKTLQRAQSVGSALSDFVGGGRKESSCAMRRSGSRGCLESLEAGSNAARAAAMVDGTMPGDDSRRERLEEDREWNFATLDRTLRPGGTFPSPQFFSQEPWQSIGKESIPRPQLQQLKRSASTGHKLASSRQKSKKSVVFEQAQESCDYLKDRLESSLKMQPECSYRAPASVSPSPAMAVPASPRREVAVLGLAEGVDGLKLSALPRSLQRRKNKERGGVKSSSAMSNAFSALVFIIKSMHGHALEMQDEHHDMVRPMQRDMDLSFEWLFQQVFATTPEYMLSIMILLAEFTVHSLGEDMALASALSIANSTLPSPPPAKKLVSSMTNQPSAMRPIKPARSELLLDEPLPFGAAAGSPSMSPEEENMMRTLMVEAMQEMETNSGWEPPPVVEKEAMKHFVAPVRVTSSPENYSCFDRTELEYQHAIGSQPTNVMLLANYAQFLYVVRHDHNRAEEYFHRAIRADPSDGEVLGRFATFLWLGRGDKEAAERAFRAAAALDPTNPYHAGNYSHFLWHSEDPNYPKCSATCYVGSE